MSDFKAQWYGEALARMQEPRLPEAPKDSRIFRFTLLPSWESATSVRLTITAHGGTLVAKRLDGNGYSSGKLVENKVRTLSRSQIDEFLRLMAKIDLEGLLATPDIVGADGSEWILEVVDGGTYRVLSRWTVEIDTTKRGLADFVAACEWLDRAAH